MNIPYFKKIGADTFKMPDSEIYLYKNLLESIIENKNNNKKHRIINKSLNDKEYIELVLLTRIL